MKSDSALAAPGQVGNYNPLAFVVIAAALVGALALQQAVGAWSPGAVRGAAVPGAASSSAAYGFLGSDVIRFDVQTGQVLARHPYHLATQNPGLAVSHDGRSVFLLDAVWDGARAVDQLTELAAATLAPQVAVATGDYARSMHAAVVVASDDRTVVIYHASRSTPTYWLTLFDRRTGQTLPGQIPLPGCGAFQLVPMAQLVVLCDNTGDLRVINLAMRQVASIIPLGSQVGRAVAAGPIQGTQAVAVITENAQLVRVDLPTRAVSEVATFAPGQGRVVPFDGAAIAPSGQAVIALAATADEPAIDHAYSLLVVDTATGQVIRRQNQASQYGMWISLDGNRVFARQGQNGPLVAFDSRAQGAASTGGATTMAQGGLSPYGLSFP